MKPVFLTRIEHIDRGSKAHKKTEPNAETGAAEQDDSDTVMVDEGRSSRAIPDVDNGIRVKMEPGIVVEDASTLEVSQTDFKYTAAQFEAMATDNRNDSELVSRISKKPNVRKHSSSKPKLMKPVLQTEEDKAEWARHLEDVHILSDELGGLLASMVKGRDQEADVNMESKADAKDGRTYIFQFPPVLPTLYNPLTTEKPKPPSFKPDVKTEKDEDIQVVGSVDKKAIDLTKLKSKNVPKSKETVVKKEELEAESELKKSKDPIVLEEGKIGKLTIRKSGRVVMKWGGTRLLLSRGAASEFLSVGAIMDHPEASREAKFSNLFQRTQTEKDKLGKEKIQKDRHGSAALGYKDHIGDTMCMGQIMGKFTVTPEWDKM
jgi:DNA-directed RNA polymerase III subunit RPC4